MTYECFWPVTAVGEQWLLGTELVTVAYFFSAKGICFELILDALIALFRTLQPKLDKLFRTQHTRVRSVGMPTLKRFAELGHIVESW